MAVRLFGSIAAAVALVLAAAPAPAQQVSDGYSFLKAVKDRDGTKAQTLLASPGSLVVNARETGSGDGALHILTRARDLTWLGFILGKGARPDLQNKQGYTPLAIAAQIGWIEGAERLLQSAAKVDQANSLGETPLIVAVHNRDMAMVRLLLANRADPNRTDSASGSSALDYARQDSRAGAIVKLLETTSKPAKPVAGPVR